MTKKEEVYPGANAVKEVLDRNSAKWDALLHDDPPMPNTKPVCTTCGSDDIRADAYAEWNVAKQEWQLSTTFDDKVCENCGGECRVEWIDIEEAK